MRGGYPPTQPPPSGGGNKGLLIFLLVLLLAGLGGFGYWAYSQGYLRGLPIPKFGSDNTTASSTGVKDTVAAKIINLKIDPPALNGFWVRFDTDKPANCYVEYGPKGSSLSNKTDPEKDSKGALIYPITSHAISVANLTQNTEYQYRVVAKILSGTETKSETQDAKTPSE